MKRGIDVSSVQGELPWKQLASLGLDFIIAKCTEGNKPGTDSQFANTVAGARSIVAAAGSYHFAYPLPHQTDNPSRDPDAQALIAFDRCGGLGANDGELPPIIDLEWPAPEAWGKWGCSAAEIRDWALAYLARAEQLWQRLPVLYTYPFFWQRIAVAGGLDAFARYPLHVADYAKFNGSVPPMSASPVMLAPWTTWTLWQHDGNGGLKLPNGVDADFDVFNGGDAEWSAFLRPAATAGAPLGASLARPPLLAPDTEPAPPPET